MKKVRLKDQEVNIIKETAEKFFGKGTKVYLFGSRVYPEKKEGDIDEKSLGTENRCSFSKRS